MTTTYARLNRMHELLGQIMTCLDPSVMDRYLDYAHDNITRLWRLVHEYVPLREAGEAEG